MVETIDILMTMVCGYILLRGCEYIIKEIIKEHKKQMSLKKENAKKIQWK